MNRSIELGALGVLPSGLTESSRLYVANEQIFPAGDEADAPRDQFASKYAMNKEAVIAQALVARGEPIGPAWEGIALRWLTMPYADAVQAAGLSLLNGQHLTFVTTRNWTKAAMPALSAVAGVFQLYARDLERYDYDPRVHALRMELLFAAEAFEVQRSFYSAIFAGMPKSAIRERQERAQAWTSAVWDQMEEYGSYVAGAVTAAALAGGSITAALVGSVAVIGTAAGPAFLAAVSAFMVAQLVAGIYDVFAGSSGSPRAPALERAPDLYFDEEAFERYVHKVHYAYKVALYRARTGRLRRAYAENEAAAERSTYLTMKVSRTSKSLTPAAKNAIAIGGGGSAAGLVWWLWKRFLRRTR